MTREELNNYIDNCILLDEIVSENSEIYRTIHDNCSDSTPFLLENLLGSVYIDGLYVKRDQEGYIHLVYYDGEYETLDLGDCIDAIDVNAFMPNILLLPIDGIDEVEVYHRKRMQLVSVSGISVTSIATRAFQASSVREINFPNVSKIGYQCFRKSKVENITFNELKVLPMHAFLDSSLKHFEGKKVSCVLRGAFQACHNLTHVYLPSAEFIEESAFWDCESLQVDNRIVKEGATW